MNTKIDRELLFRYFSGFTTPLENAGIERWLENKDNEEIFYLNLERWERKNAQYLPDKESVFIKFEEKLEPNKRPDLMNSKHKGSDTKMPKRRWWIIAAAFSVLICVAGLSKDGILYITYNTNFGETITLVLDDDSKVILNANTKLLVPRWRVFSTHREVWMNGEAFFDITKKSNRSKFIVHTNSLDVEVLGTRFNVSDRRDATKVVLQEGKVKVTAKNNTEETAMLEKAGDYAEVKVKSPDLVTRSVDESLYTSWQEKRLKFKETPVQQVLQTIEDYYGIRIGSSDTTLYNRKFSGTLPNNDIDVILQALTNIYGSEFNQFNQ